MKRISKVEAILNKKKYKVKNYSNNGKCHLIINEDSLNVISDIPSGSIDLIITDPPYNKGLNYGKGFKDSKPWIKYYNWLQSHLEELPRILKTTGTFYLISYPEINARLLPFLEDELGLKFRRWLTWHYPTNIGHSYKNYTRSQRSILYFTKSNKYVFNRQHIVQHYKNPTAPVIRKRIANGSKGRTSYDLLRFLDLFELQKGQIDVLDINLLKNVSRERYRNLKDKFRPMTTKELILKDHPCQLPLSLLELFVKVSSNKSSIVLDPFAGSFTTSIAAGRLGRNSLGIEINGKFTKFGLSRLKRSLKENE